MDKAISMNLENNLKGLKFPASREEVVAFAEQQGADERVCSQLRQMPNQHFRSMSDIHKALGSISGETKANRN